MRAKSVLIEGRSARLTPRTITGSAARLLFRVVIPALTSLLIPCTAMGAGTLPMDDAPAADMMPGKPRLFVLTDIGNEPDDQMSMVRLMLYVNEIDVEGLVATTSTWLRAQTNPQSIRGIIETYGKVQPNLLKHAKGWPEAALLAQRASMGQLAYGMVAVGPGKSSLGSDALIRAAHRSDPRPLWISV